MVIEVFVQTRLGNTLTVNIEENATGAQLIQTAEAAMREYLQETRGFKASPVMEAYLASISYYSLGKEIPRDSSKLIIEHGIFRESKIHHQARMARYSSHAYAYQLLEDEQILNSIEQSKEKNDSSKLSALPKIKEHLNDLKTGFAEHNPTAFSLFQPTIQAVDQQLARLQTLTCEVTSVPTTGVENKRPQ
jgi:hypothetical protein